jgi:hypothetical protein
VLDLLKNPKVLGGALALLGPVCGGLILSDSVQVQAGGTDHTTLAGAVVVMFALAGGALKAFLSKRAGTPPAGPAA